MRPSNSISNLLVCSAFVTAAAATDVTSMLARPVTGRFWQTGTYTLGDRVNASQAGKALAGLKPSYVSGIFRFAYEDTVTGEMKQDYHTIREAVLSANPDARFDMELNLDPNATSGHKTTYPNAEAVVDMMKYLNSELTFDGFYFDFLSTAEKKNATWVEAVVNYTRSTNQTVGGNVFGTKSPPGVDFVGFTDSYTGDNPQFGGYGINESMLAQLKKHNKEKTYIICHMNNNPQNAPNTLSCVFIQQWNATRRADYQNYWISQQQNVGGFTYMFPVFFPQCPSLTAYDSLNDTIPDTNGETVYDRMRSLALSYDR